MVCQHVRYKYARLGFIDSDDVDSLGCPTDINLLLQCDLKVAKYGEY